MNNKYRRYDDPNPNAPMSVEEFDEHRAYLGFPDDKALADAMMVAPISVSRWKKNNKIPGPVRAALRAWRRLFNAGAQIPGGIIPLHNGMSGDALRDAGLLP